MDDRPLWWIYQSFYSNQPGTTGRYQWLKRLRGITRSHRLLP
ncbi:MAG: hypothetical protein U7126_18905 [Microcoleus sp.]